MRYETMEKEAARRAKFKMEPLPEDPRIEQMYPGMVTSEKVLEAVDKMRDEQWDALNEDKRNNTPATQEEVQAWADMHPAADLTNADVQAEIQSDLQRSRTVKLMYGRSGHVTHDEIQEAKTFMVSGGITLENRKKLEKAADAWHDTYGSWEGWETRRLELLKELVGE